MQDTTTELSIGAKHLLCNSENQTYFKTGLDAIAVLTNLNGTFFSVNQYVPEICYIEHAIKIHNQKNDTSGLFTTSFMAVTAAVSTLAKEIEKTSGISRFITLAPIEESFKNGMYLKASKNDFEALKSKFYELRDMVFSNGNAPTCDVTHNSCCT